MIVKSLWSQIFNGNLGSCMDFEKGRLLTRHTQFCGSIGAAMYVRVALAHWLLVIAWAAASVAMWKATSVIDDSRTRRRIVASVLASIVIGSLLIWFDVIVVIPPLPTPINTGAISAQTILSTDRNIIPEIEIGASGVIFTTAKFAPNGINPMFEIGKIFMGEGRYAYESLSPIFTDTHFELDSILGELKVSISLWDEHGDLIARLIRNNWDLGLHPVAFDRNYDNSSLEVQDRSGNIVLQITSLPDRVRLQLVCFRKNGNRAYVVQSVGSGRCCALVSFNNTAKDDVSNLIRPMFRYPSSAHLGEKNE